MGEHRSRAIHGAKGGEEQRAPIEAPDSLYSTAIARIVDLLSEGEIVGLENGLKDVLLDETPVQNEDGSLNFKSVQIDTRTGTPDQAYLPGFSAVESEIGIGVELKQVAPWTRAVSNLQLSAVKIRLAVDALTKGNPDNGDINGSRVEYAIDLAVDGGAFVELFRSAFAGKTSTLYERTHRVDLPAATTGWTVRVRRVTADSDSQYIQDKTFVQAITEIVDAKLRYPYSALVGITLDSSQFRAIPRRAYRAKGRIIRVPTNYDPVTREYSGLWNGTFKLAWTTNPAWIYYDLITNTRYGLGRRIPEARIDKWALYQIGMYCDEPVSDGRGGTEPRFECTVYLQKRANAYKVLRDLASVFRGISYWGGGTIIAHADRPEDPVFTYTNATVVDGKFTYHGTSRRARHTVAMVAWVNNANLSKAEVEPVIDEDGIIRYGIQQTSVTAFGCISQSQAQRVGRWILLTELAETEAISFDVGLDGTLVAPGRIVRIADADRAGRRIGGRISSASASAVVVDKLPEVLPSAGDTLVTATAAGEAQVSTVSSVDPVTRTIAVSAPFPSAPAPQSAWAVESEELETQLFRILGVTDNKETGGYSLTAIQHNPSKFSAVDDGTQLEDRDISALPAQPTIAAPSSVTLTSVERAGEVLTSILVSADWADVPGASGYAIQWQRDDGPWSTAEGASSSSAEWPDAFPGTWRARVWALGPNGIVSAATLSNALVVGDQTTPPHVIVDIQGDLAAQWQEILDNAQAILDNAAILTQELLDRAAADLGLAEDLAQEATDRAAADLGLATDLATDAQNLADEVVAREQALVDEAAARATAIAEAVSASAGVLQAQVDVVRAQVADIYGADEWSALTDYLDGELVVGDGHLYRALQDVPAGTPLTDAAYWESLGNYTSLGEAVAANLVLSTSTATDVSALSTTVTSHDARLDGTEADVTALQVAYADADEALAQDIAALEATVDDPATGVNATATGLSGLTTRVTAAENTDTALAQDISSLDARLGADDVLGPELVTDLLAMCTVSGVTKALTPEGWLSLVAIDASSNRGEFRFASFGGSEVDAVYRIVVVAKRGAQGTTQQFLSPVALTGVPTTSIPSTDWTTFTFTATATSTAAYLRIYANTAGATGDEVVIQSVSIRKFTSDVTFADAVNGLTARVEGTEDGITALAEDVTSLEANIGGEMLGPEMVYNGDLSHGLDGIVSSGGTGTITLDDYGACLNKTLTTTAIRFTPLLSPIVAGKRYRVAFEWRWNSGQAICSVNAGIYQGSIAPGTVSLELTATAASTYVTLNSSSSSTTFSGSFRNLTVREILTASQLATAVSALDVRVTQNEGDIESTATDVTSLQVAVSDPSTGNAALGTALSSLTAEVSSIDGVVTSQGSAITSLDSRLDTAEGTLAGQVSGLSGLTTTVTEQGDDIEALGSALTALDATVADKADASAVSALDVRVTQNEGDITSLASESTSLQSRVGTVEGALANTIITSAQEGAVLTAAVSVLTAGLTDLDTGLTALGSITDSLTTRVTAAEGTITSQGSALTALENTIEDPTTGLTATASGLTSLTTQVEALGDDVDAVASSLTSLTATVDDKAETTALTALDARVVTAEGNISSQGSAITSLDSRLDTAEGTLAGQATAITVLQTSVSAKSKTFYQASQPTTGMNAGDQWVDSDDSNRLYVYSGSAWVDASASGITVFAQASAPSTSGRRTGDLWIETDNSNKVWRWSGAAWVDASDARIAANSSAITSLEATVNDPTTGVTATASAISGLTTDVSVMDGVVTSMSAKFFVMLDVNDYISGIESVNDGTTSAFRVRADVFEIVNSTESGARTQFSDGNWRVYDSSGTLRVRLGVW